MADQRTHPRFSVKEGAIAAIKPYSDVLGQIIDISIGGLSFQYLDSHFNSKQGKNMLILFTKADFLLEDIPFSTVADFKMAESNRFSSLPMRRRCVRFKSLSLDQTQSLMHFILSHTINASTATQHFNSQAIDPHAP